MAKDHDAKPAFTNADWKKAREQLRTRLGEMFDLWCTTMSFVHCDTQNEKATLVFSVSSTSTRDWITEHYQEDILRACRSVRRGCAKTVVIELRKPIAKQTATEPEQALASDTSSEQPDQPTQKPAEPVPVQTQAVGLDGSMLDPRFTFANFIGGDANKMALAAARSVAEAFCQGKPNFNPVYLYARPGQGKTHLLQAIAWEGYQQKPEARMLYLTAERFRYCWPPTRHKNRMAAMMNRFFELDLLLIDDFNLLYNSAVPPELEVVINTLLKRGRQVVLSAICPPSAIGNLDQQLSDRLQSQLLIEISAPEEALRRTLLERHIAKTRQLNPEFTVPIDVVDYLVEKLDENCRQLESVCLRMIAHWHYMRAPITKTVAESIVKVLTEDGDLRAVRIQDVIRVVTRHFGISKADILSKRRHRNVVWPRQIGMYLSHQLTGRSLPEIGRRFGNRDHTTVLHAIRKIEGALQGNQRLRAELDDLKKLLEK